jgi:hypothetical protein
LCSDITVNHSKGKVVSPKIQQQELLLPVYSIKETEKSWHEKFTTAPQVTTQYLG